MGRRIFIENLDAKLSEKELRELLEEHGQVEQITIARDQDDETTQVAFVTMKGAKHGRAVIEALDGKTHGEKQLSVKALKQEHDNPKGPANTGGPGGSGPGRGGFGKRGGLYGHKGRGKGGGRHQ